MSKKAKLELDERTAELTDEALICRAADHVWQRVPSSIDRRRELYDLNLCEWIWHCLTCGSVRNLVFSRTSGEGKPTINYAEGYLISNKYAGLGRIPRTESRKAACHREDAGLF